MVPRALSRTLLPFAIVAVVAAACSGQGEAGPAAGSATTPASPPGTATRTALAATAVTTPDADDLRPAPPLVGLVDAGGSTFDLADQRGSPTLLFFGYTHCPDVCPATIGELFGVLEARPDVQAVFVSVDPERDTPEFLDRWTRYFPDNFHALTGSPGAVRRAADGYGVRYARVETTSTVGYTMSHSADVYLIDPAGLLLRSYPFGTPAETMVADLSRLSAG